MDADLRPVFNWNVKQLFVYVTAEYATALNEKNSIVVWSSIIEDKRDAHVQLHDSPIHSPPYKFVDQGNHLRGANVTLRLQWDVTPWAGRLYVGKSATAASFVLPNDYFSL